MTKNFEGNVEHTDYEEDVIRYFNLNIIYNLYFKYNFFHPTYIGRNDISILGLNRNI